jgi:hypothetical protein
VEQWNTRHFALIARCKWSEGPAIRSEVSFRFGLEQWNTRHFALIARCKWCEGLGDANRNLIRSQIYFTLNSQGVKVHRLRVFIKQCWQSKGPRL